MLRESETIVRFKNCRLVRNGLLVNDDLWIQGGKVLNPEVLYFIHQKSADVEIDCRGNIVAPGFIELQINGAYGYDFSQQDVDVQHAIRMVANKLVRHGVTSFCPTIVTQPAHNYPHLLSKMKRGPIVNGATVLGAHIEGPFICARKKGAHPEKYIRNQPIKSFQQIQDVLADLSNTSIITMAPELDECNVIGELTSRGIHVSMGHSSATLEHSERGFRNGARLITHLFNAMPVFHHRDPGLLGLLTIDSDKQIYYGIIADGIHTHYSALRLAFKANQAGMILVSDACSAAGLEHGIHTIGSQSVEVKHNAAYVAGTNTLCGSVALLDRCAQNMLNTVPESCIVDVINCATLHPARALAIDKCKGTLAFGSDADFVILNDQLDLLGTFVDGKHVYSNGEYVHAVPGELWLQSVIV